MSWALESEEKFARLTWKEEDQAEGLALVKFRAVKVHSLALPFPCSSGHQKLLELGPSPYFVWPSAKQNCRAQYSQIIKDFKMVAVEH